MTTDQDRINGKEPDKGRNPGKAKPNGPRSGAAAKTVSKSRNGKPLPEAGAEADSAPKFIVGIGSSAGGLEALRALFGALKNVSTMAFIVVQHLAPQHRSRLVEILSHSTDLRVKECQDGDVPESKTIYITPPNSDVYLENKVLRLASPHMKIGPKPSIDYFFRSLADNYGESAIGVILSGTGSDGAMGVRAIKAAGGFTISQSLSSAKYDGMPKSAKHTGSVDLELDPEEIAKEFTRFNGMDKIERSHDVVAENDPFEEIINVLYRHNGACFSQYKRSTVRRRIERRIIATRCSSMDDYLNYLYEHTDEAGNLFQDILISVTSFFRDAESFSRLEEFVRQRVREKPGGTPFRCWVVGCATGEEVYSLAILVAEAIEKCRKSLSMQIFATDIDEQALSIARRGCYSGASFEKFPAELKDKYFNPLDDQFQIKPSLRDGIVFARHNIGEDAPFLNTDLVSCRNVLIYFNQRLQEGVFQTMHYSLGKGGLLFLGRSEAVPGTLTHLFNVSDKQAKIYTRNEYKSELPKAISRQGGGNFALEVPVPSPEVSANASDELFQSMVRGFAPDSVILDGDLCVKHVFGDANRYLTFPQGQATTAIGRLLPAEIAMELSSLVHKARNGGEPVRGRKHESAAQDRSVQLVVVPLSPAGRQDILVAFEAGSPGRERPRRRRRSASTLSPQAQIERLEQELVTTREHLQTVVEEHETSNEEMQSLNEELQSTNEELQSSNEELETTNEELQSTNEELTTLNQELNVKSSELMMLYQRYQAVQNAIVYPLLIVDRNLHILNFNPSARHLLRLGESDVGSHLRAVPTPIDLGKVVASVEQALEKQSDTRIQFRTKDRCFEVQCQVFRGDGSQLEGIVVSFVDNTEINNILDETKLIKSRLASIVDNTPSLVTMKDLSGVYMFANQRFCELTSLSREEVVGSTDDELFGADAAVMVRERDYEVLKRKEALPFDESYLLGGEMRFWTSVKFPLLDNRKRPYSVCTISIDITERVVRERQLELFQRAISAANNGTVILEDAGPGLEVSFCSQHLTSRLGLSQESVLGLNLDGFFKALGTRAGAAEVKEAISDFKTSKSAIHAFTIPSPKEGDLCFEIRSSLVDHQGDEKRHLILSLFDVTQRLNDQRTILAQQEELTRFGRFSALGEIAAGISHEINTPLNVITTKTDMLRKASQLGKLDRPRIEKLADDIDRMTKDISSIVFGLKSAAGIDAGNFESGVVQKLIADTIKICEFRLQRHGVELRLDMPEAPIRIDCYPVQVMQIFINLINNAIDAIQPLKKRWIEISVRDIGSKVRIQVRDSGDGIDPSMAEMIMTPFFTTKKETNGTGIGLSLSRSIARRHNGDLRTEPGAKQTTFVLELGKEAE